MVKKQKSNVVETNEKDQQPVQKLKKQMKQSVLNDRIDQAVDRWTTASKENKNKLLNEIADTLIETNEFKYSIGVVWFKKSPLDDIWTNEFETPIYASFEKWMNYMSCNQQEELVTLIKRKTKLQVPVPIKKEFNVYFIDGIVTKNGFKEYKEKTTFNPFMIQEEFSTWTNLKKNKKFQITNQGIKKIIDNWSLTEKGKDPEKKNGLLGTIWLHLCTQNITQFLNLVGNGNNGKSYFCKIIQSLVGAKAGSGNLSNFNSSSFALASFIGKTSMTFDDCDNNLLNCALLKQVVGGGAGKIFINLKNRDAINSTIYTSIILNSNNPLHFTDKSNGMERRILATKFIIDFNKHPEFRLTKEEEKAIWADEDNLTTLAKQIFYHYAFEGFSKSFDWTNKIITLWKEALDAIDEAKLSNNPVLEWLRNKEVVENNIDTEDGWFVYPQYFFDKYREDWKTDHDGTDKGFGFKNPRGLWNQVIQVLQQEYSDQIVLTKKNNQRVGDSMVNGYLITRKQKEESKK